MTGQHPNDQIEAMRRLVRQALDMGLDKSNPAQMRVLAGMLETLQAARDTGPPADPRWEWINVTTYGGKPEYVKGACRHLTPAEVRSTVTGELLAHLCPDCDAQLPA